MAPHVKYGIAGVIIGLILLWILPWWAGVAVIAAAVAIPAIAYRMLSPSQRRRLRGDAGRKQLRG